MRAKELDKKNSPATSAALPTTTDAPIARAIAPGVIEPSFSISKDDHDDLIAIRAVKKIWIAVATVATVAVIFANYYIDSRISALLGTRELKIAALEEKLTKLEARTVAFAEFEEFRSDVSCSSATLDKLKQFAALPEIRDRPSLLSSYGDFVRGCYVHYSERRPDEMEAAHLLDAFDASLRDQAIREREAVAYMAEHYIHRMIRKDVPGAKINDELSKASFYSDAAARFSIALGVALNTLAAAVSGQPVEKYVGELRGDPKLCLVARNQLTSGMMPAQIGKAGDDAVLVARRAIEQGCPALPPP